MDIPNRQQETRLLHRFAPFGRKHGNIFGRGTKFANKPSALPVSEKAGILGILDTEEHFSKSP